MEQNISKYLQDINIRQYKSDVGFKTLMEGVNDNLYVIPKYQRKYKWTKEKLQDLIISLICGFPIPPIYTYRNSKNQLEILDGQQRIFSLFFYYIGKYINIDKNKVVDYKKLNVDGRSFKEALEEAYELEDLNIKMSVDEGTEIDISYDKLPGDIRRALDYVTITVIEMRWPSSQKRSETIQTIFRNLNRGGVQLEEQEIRNGVFDCKFYDMLHEFNENNEIWRNLWGEETKEKDVELLLKLCAYKKYVCFENGEFVFKEYQGKQSVFLDCFSEYVMKLNDNADEIENYKNSLEKFMKQMIESSLKKKSSAVLTGVYIVNEKCNLNINITKEMITEILNSEGYKNSTTQGTFSKKNMCERWKNIYEILSKYSG